mgnify:CR=1 FL=1
MARVAQVLLWEPDGAARSQLSSVIDLSGCLLAVCASPADLAAAAAADPEAKVMASADDPGGPQLAARLSAAGHRGAILLLASRLDFATRREAVRAGAGFLLPKPVDPARLLPILEGQARAEEASPYRVLIVGDDALSNQYHAALLEAAGIEAATAASGEEALVVVEAGAPDLILPDYFLGDCTGPELIAMLRNDDRLASLRVVILSARDPCSLEAEVRDALGEDFIAKPVNPAAFVNLVRSRAAHARRAKRLNDELRQARREARDVRLAMDSHAIVSVINGAGDFAYVNEGFCRTSGYPRQELLGRNHRLLASAAHSEAFYANLWRTLESGRTWQGELCHRARDGSLYWVQSTITPNPGDDGGARRYVSVSTDITVQKEVAARLSTLIDTVNVGLAWTDADGRVLDLNEPFAKLLGYPREALLALRVGDLAHADDREDAGRQLRRLAAGEASVRFQKRYVRQDGEVVWADVMFSRIDDAQGHMVGAAGSFADFSALKRAQEELRQAKESAEEASRAKTDFLSRMTHELRTPLNAILGFAQLLESDPADRPTAGQAESLGQIQRAGWHLLDLINEVLDLARIEAGRLEVSPVDFPLADIVADCLTLVSPLASRYGVTVLSTLGAAPRVHADPMRLKQAVLNLLSNAVKYNRPGGTVHVEGVAVAEGWRLDISDTGIGMSEAQLTKLFEPFTRFAEDGQREGTGIGLAITKRLIEAMGGQIVARSRPGEGSTFSIVLPGAGPAAKVPAGA